MIVTSYLLFHIYYSKIENFNTQIFYANILVLNRTIDDGEKIQYSGGFNIFENLFNNNTNEPIINDSEIIETLEIENIEELRNLNLSEYIPEHSEEYDYFNNTENIESNLNIPIMNFSFYENGTILDVYFSTGLNEEMILLLNSTLYEIIPDISQSSNLRILSTNDNETKSIFQSEINEEGNFNGFNFENSEIKSISNNTIDNELESLTNIHTIGEAKLISNENIQNEDDEYSENDDNKRNVIPSELKEFYMNKTTDTKLILSTRNNSINEFMISLNMKINYTLDNKNEYNLRLLNSSNSKYIKNKKKKIIKDSLLDYLDLLEDEYLYSYSLIKTNILGLKISFYAALATTTFPGYISVQIIVQINSAKMPILNIPITPPKIGTVISLYIKFMKATKKIIENIFEDIRITVKKD
jgi:hypothetical protein